MRQPCPVLCFEEDLFGPRPTDVLGDTLTVPDGRNAPRGIRKRLATPAEIEAYDLAFAPGPRFLELLEYRTKTTEVWIACACSVVPAVRKDHKQSATLGLV